MKQLLGFGGGLAAGAAIVLAVQIPARAFTQVKNIQLIESEGQLNLVLETSGNGRPEVFVIRRGNEFVADVINAQITNGSDTFEQNNPVPGVASVMVTQIDPTSIRIIVSGTSAPPEARVVQGDGQGIVVAVAPGSAAPQQAAQLPASNSQDVLVPEPDVSVTAPDATTAQGGEVIVPEAPGVSQAPITELDTPRPTELTPPFLPRAIAPPVGDIAVSNVNPAIPTILLNSTEVIPRLVLRDASVRDVLSLLGRVAGVNIAFSSATIAQQGEAGQAPFGGVDQTISLDIENESVQDVFNYVLRLTGLEANRVGNTVFVGSKLPNSARNVVIRSFRLNQASARTASNFLVSMGAEGATVREIRTIEESREVELQAAGEGTEDQEIQLTETSIETEIERQRLEDLADSFALLRGLQVIVDERLNTITLVGPPHLVEIGAAQLVQLDLRQRQVAVNVKVLDINLSGQDIFNSSFSFGVNDSFFVNDGGAATLNFGGINPPSGADLGGINARPIVPNTPVSGFEPFFDRDGIQSVPLTAPGEEGGQFLRAVPPVTDRPNRVGISDIEPFERDDDGNLSELGEATFSTFPLFQFPRSFLATLQAQVISGNAKILTDPTLVVQEGESAAVALVERLVERVTTTFVDTEGSTREVRTPEFVDVGLTLAVNVERIDDNGFITLTVNPEVSSPIGTISLSDDEADFALQISRREVDSGRIRLRDGQTLILSGIIQDQERVTVSKIPILGDLPIIGALFRNTNKETDRAEVIVLLTPNILDDSDRAPYGYEYNLTPDSQRLLEQRGR
ncbi:MAG: AMIN domain-containing protein [Microcoleaceae cyanobacterium]